MTVEQFVDTYYKPDRLYREEDTREQVIANCKRDMERYRRADISKHASITGRAMTLYDANKVLCPYIPLTKGEEEV
jgi:hypothetical protein